MRDPLLVLVLTTITTAVFHTLIPDHWLPFVLVARSEGWGSRRTAIMTAGSAILHVALSVGLGLAAFWASSGAASIAGLGASIGRISSTVMVLFGAVYAGWFFLEGGHHHSFGVHPHHAPGVAHERGRAHPHDMEGATAMAVPPAVGLAGTAAVAGRRARLSGLALAGIVGFNPCLLVIPYIHYAGSMGTGALVAVSLAFALSTVVCMVAVALIGLRGTARLESPFLIRYGEVLSGALIAATGLVVMLFGG
ncbi:MAG: hypothetical protein HY049_03960 [Acidobacteria bacterium]|nr:hypothetical protein [Acidobacteriota bacterium]